MNYDDAKTSARPFMKPLSTCIALVAAVMFFGCKQNIGTESKTPTAQYKVTVEKTSGGNVTVTPALPESGMVDKDTVLTFTATKLGSYKFVKWERDRSRHRRDRTYLQADGNTGSADKSCLYSR